MTELVVYDLKFEARRTAKRRTLDVAIDRDALILSAPTEILGHTSATTTERYANVMVQPQRAVPETLGRLHQDRQRTK